MTVQDTSIRKQIKGQLTVRGIAIGCIGCAIITASSIYVALKMGALPWPIVFAAILSFFFLKIMGKGKVNLNEVNVTHTVMSSGAMVAGGLAFTIPGAWMLGFGGDISWVELIVIAIAGSILGLVASVAFRRHFIEEASLEYPIGEAAAETIKAGDKGGRTGVKLFSSMGFAGIYALLRDALGILPSMFAQLPIPGVAFGIYNSPMMLAVGYLVGFGAVLVWFIGALIANFGIVVGFPALGIADLDLATKIASCLGMGCMMGAGVAVIVKDIVPKGWSMLKKAKNAFNKAYEDTQILGLTAQSSPHSGKASLGREFEGEADRLVRDGISRKSIGVAIFIIACVAVALCLVLGLPPVVSIVVVLCAFVACAMSAQSVGQTGIDPMEIFGLIVLLLVALFAQIDEMRLFFIAALVAVACGLAGDVMNDFKAGHILGTNPKAQWIGQAIGAVIGSVVAVFVIQVLFSAFGADAFGVGKEFVAAQASVVASMVGGIPNIESFVVGIVIGFVLYMVRFPSMMLGLGLYLPFYMSFTAFLGTLVKLAIDAVVKKRACSNAGADEEASHEAVQERADESGIVIASGLLGGESIMGIILAFVVAASAFV